jgi:hypothetical protein
MKWMLWNDGVDMAELGMTSVRIGLFQHALAHPEANSEWFESIEAKLDELRSYLYANRESVRGSGIIQCRWISPPDPQVFTGLDLSTVRQRSYSGMAGQS